MSKAKAVALGGILGALAMVIMSLGTMIPVNTYLCPAVAMLLCQVISDKCGKRICLAWYAMVSVLCILLCPDKEAAGVFVAFGYYPILKPYLDKSKLAVLWKFLIFNTNTLLLYSVLIFLVGISAADLDLNSFGKFGIAVLIFLGDILLFMLDFLLSRLNRLRWFKYG